MTLASPQRPFPSPAAPVPTPAKRSGVARFPLGVALASTLLLTAACGEEGVEGEALVRTDSAGVAILRSEAPDLPLAGSSEILFTLGGGDAPEEAFYRVGPWNVGADRQGRIHVLDLDANYLHLFDADGVHLRTVGGRGGGPGEIQMAGGLSVDLEGGAWVVDLRRSAFVRFDAGGELQPQAPLPDGFFGGILRWTPSGLVVPVRGPGGAGLSLVGNGGDGESLMLAELPPVETRPVFAESCGMGFSGQPPIFSPSVVWAAAGDRVVVNRGPEYVIDVYEAGRHVRSLRRNLAPRIATAEMAIASLGEGMQVRLEDRTVVCDAAEIVEQQGFAPTLPMFRQLAVAPDGAVWAERYEIGDTPGLVDRFTPEGRYLGTLPAGSRIPIAFLPDGRALWSERDDFEVERLVVGRK